MVAWSTTDKSANITLSGGNLTATFSSAVRGGVRCDTSFAGGLLYFEVVNTANNNIEVGWANATQALTTELGANTNGISAEPNTARVLFNSSSLGPVTVSTGLLVVPWTLCVAINFTTKLFWARVNGYGWNGSATADPAAGTGGYSFATIAAGPYFPMFTSSSSGASITARFGASSMWFPIPAGFSTLDTNVQAFNATAKFDGMAVLVAPQAAASAYKMLGQSILIAPRSVASAYKMVGYAILRPRNDNYASRSRLAAYLRM